MDEKREECGYPYADCRFRDELRTLRAENRELKEILGEVQSAVNNANARVAIECDPAHSGQGEK